MNRVFWGLGGRKDCHELGIIKFVGGSVTFDSFISGLQPLSSELGDSFAWHVDFVVSFSE